MSDVHCQHHGDGCRPVACNCPMPSKHHGQMTASIRVRVLRMPTPVMCAKAAWMQRASWALQRHLRCSTLLALACSKQVKIATVSPTAQCPQQAQKILLKPIDHANFLSRAGCCLQLRCMAHIGGDDLAVLDHVCNHLAISSPRLHVGSEQIAGTQMDKVIFCHQSAALQIHMQAVRLP